MKKILFLLLGITMLAGCDRIEETLNLINCKYKLNNIGNITWAGINLSNIHHVNDLSIIDLANAATAIAQRDFNLNFDANVLAVNNTSRPASGIKGFDYALQLDQTQLTSGENNNQDIYVAPNGGEAIIPIGMNVDLEQLLSGDALSSIVNFASNLTRYGNGEPSNVSLKFRPWVELGSTIQKLPYITLNHTLQ